MARTQLPDPENIYRSSWLHYYNQRKLLETEGQRGSRTATEKEHRHPKSNDVVRWAMARESQIALSGTQQSYDIFMQWWVNPSECSWNVGLRSSITKTSGGAIHNEIPYANDPKYTRFEFPILNISFQSGITLQSAYRDIKYVEGQDVIPHGVRNFYDFVDLIDQPNQLADGSPNYVNILYVSSTHGAKGIWLKGFFTEDGMSWTDSANDPLMISGWRASFMVWDINPMLRTLKGNYQSPAFRSPFTTSDAIAKREQALREQAQRNAETGNRRSLSFSNSEAKGRELANRLRRATFK